MFFSKSTHIWTQPISMFYFMIFMVNNAPFPCTSRGRIWISKFIGGGWVLKDVCKGLIPIFRNIFLDLTNVFQVTALNMIIRSMYGILYCLHLADLYGKFVGESSVRGSWQPIATSPEVTPKPCPQMPFIQVGNDITQDIQSYFLSFGVWMVCLLGSSHTKPSGGVSNLDV